MANEKILNTRIQLKYDSLANWNKNNPTLKEGELAIAYLADSHTTTTPDNGTHPILFKVGPGAFNSLPFASALAADVYAWAKQATLPVERATNDGETAGNVISGISWDAINNKIVYTTASVATSEGMEDLQKAVQAIEKDITDNRDAWSEKTVDTNDNTTYAFAIVDGKLQVTETPHILGVAGEAVVTSYDFVTPDELTTILANYYTKAEVDNLIDKIDTGIMGVHGEGAISVVGNVYPEISLTLDNSGNVTLSQSENGLKAEITAADLGLANAMHFIGAFAQAPSNPKAGDVYLNTATHKEYVYDETQGWVELGDEGSHALKTITITGTDGLTGGGTLEANREIKLSDATKESLRKADNSK